RSAGSTNLRHPSDGSGRATARLPVAMPCVRGRSPAPRRGALLRAKTYIANLNFPARIIGMPDRALRPLPKRYDNLSGVAPDGFTRTSTLTTLARAPGLGPWLVSGHRAGRHGDAQFRGPE